MYNIKQFASAEHAADGDIFSVLGINWPMLATQLVAFLALVWLLGKFVYPWLLKSIDDRQAKIDDSVKAASRAESMAIESEERIAKLMKKAKSEASDIIASAKAESAATIKAAEEKSQKRADQIVTDAAQQISKDVAAAKQALHNEMIDLVSSATEKIVGKVVSKEIDEKLISDAIKGSK